MKPQVQFFAQYCDDVRREADGRISLMGIHPGDIAIPKGVETISRIAVQAVIIVPTLIGLDLPSVSVSVQSDSNESLRKLNLPLEMVEKLTQARGDEAPNVERVIISFVIELKDIQLSASDALRTFAHVGGETLEGPPLHIKRLSKDK